MRILNVSEVKDDNIVKLESFPIHDDQFSNDVWDEAREHLIKLINFRHETINLDELDVTVLPIKMSGYTWNITQTYI